MHFLATLNWKTQGNKSSWAFMILSFPGLCRFMKLHFYKYMETRRVPTPGHKNPKGRLECFLPTQLEDQELHEIHSVAMQRRKQKSQPQLESFLFVRMSWTRGYTQSRMKYCRWKCFQCHIANQIRSRKSKRIGYGYQTQDFKDIFHIKNLIILQQQNCSWANGRK